MDAQATVPSKGAYIVIGMELVKVAYLDAGGCAQRDAAAVARNIARESGSEVTWTGFNEGATHGSIGRRLLHLRRASTLAAERVCNIGAYVTASAVTDTTERVFHARAVGSHSRQIRADYPPTGQETAP